MRELEKIFRHSSRRTKVMSCLDFVATLEARAAEMEATPEDVLSHQPSTGFVASMVVGYVRALEAALSERIAEPLTVASDGYLVTIKPEAGSN